MLDTLLKTTQLTAHAFRPKPKDLDLVKNSEQFWQEKYQTLEPRKEFNDFYNALNQQHAEIDQLFETLIEAIKKLTNPYQLLEESIEALQGLQGRYWHPFFSNRREISSDREKIKKQLEIIAYFLIINDDFDKKMLIASHLSEANVCAEGCYSKLQEILEELNNDISPDHLSNSLTHLRKEIIYRYYSNYYNDRLVHSYVTLLTYAQEIGLNVVDDDAAYHRLKKDQYIQPLSKNEKKAFIDFFCSQYNVRTIIEYINEQLQLETNKSLGSFQKQVYPFGLVFYSNNFMVISEHLKYLPVSPSVLFTEIEEDSNYFKLKSTKEIKNGVILYLLEKNIFKKQSKTFIFNGEILEFNTIEGDYDCDYGFILKNDQLHSKETYPLSAFEEKKLYQDVSLAQFYANKTFFSLGQNAFNYFYEKKANFSKSYLVDIDFQALDADFITTLYDTNDDDASFIRAKLTYEQLLCFYKLKKYHTLNNNYLVTMTNAEQFYNIIMEMIGPNKKEQASFLERHTPILIANKLYLDILQYLKGERIKKEKDIQEMIKKINIFDEYAFLLSATEVPLFVMGFILIGAWEFFYLPLVYFCVSLLFAIVLIPIFFIMLEELQDNPDFFPYERRLKELKNEDKVLKALDEKMIEFSHEQEKIAATVAKNNESKKELMLDSPEKTTATMAKNNENKVTSATACSPNPTRISTHLFKDRISPIKKATENALLNTQYTC